MEMKEDDGRRCIHHRTCVRGTSILMADVPAKTCGSELAAPATIFSISRLADREVTGYFSLLMLCLLIHAWNEQA